MHILITGICIFVGLSLVKELLAKGIATRVTGMGSFCHPSSENNKRQM